MCRCTSDPFKTGGDSLSKSSPFNSLNDHFNLQNDPFKEQSKADFH